MKKIHMIITMLHMLENKERDRNIIIELLQNLRQFNYKTDTITKF